MGDQYVKQLRCLPALKIEKKKNSICKGSGSCSGDEPERLDWMFIAIKLNSELSFSSDPKTRDNTKLQSEQFGTGI